MTFIRLARGRELFNFLVALGCRREACAPPLYREAARGLLGDDRIYGTQSVATTR